MMLKKRLARSNIAMFVIPVLVAVVLLLKLMPPGTDGFTVCRTVRAQNDLTYEKAPGRRNSDPTLPGALAILLYPNAAAAG